MPLRELLLIVNPHSGVRRGRQVLEKVQGILGKVGFRLTVIETRAPGHATQLVRDARLEDFVALGVVGGDGTLHEVLNGLLNRDDARKIPIAVFPSGTGNTVMEHLGCLDPIQVARHLIAGDTCPIDVARVAMTDRVVYCCNIVGWGVVTEINAAAERLRWLGPCRYTLATLLHLLSPRPRRVRLTIDGRQEDRELLFAIGCNTRSTGRGMCLAPRAEIADGKIDLVLVRNAPRLQLLRMFRRVFAGSHLQEECVEYHQVREFTITPEANSGLNLDGELRGTTPCEVTVLHRAITLIGPPNRS